MRVCFLGTSHAAMHLAQAAASKGFVLVSLDNRPDLVFVSEDTPTEPDGTRRIEGIRALVEKARATNLPLVITSQVPPGFTRAYAGIHVYHQAETLRIRDAVHRARHPEMMIVGMFDPAIRIVEPYWAYLRAFDCPVLTMSYESAEFAKIAINACLASQVETTNRLAAAAEKCGATWADVRRALEHDSRIGPQAYLAPGCWQDSVHLLRDVVTLKTLEAA